MTGRNNNTGRQLLADRRINIAYMVNDVVNSHYIFLSMKFDPTKVCFKIIELRAKVIFISQTRL